VFNGGFNTYYAEQFMPRPCAAANDNWPTAADPDDEKYRQQAISTLGNYFLLHICNEKGLKKYHNEGFEILDFPCNQFGQQAPGTDESIHEFCKLNFGTEFPRFKKIKVNGEDAEPLYKFLQEQKGFAGWDMEHPIAHILDDMLSKADPDYKDKPDIKWNFTKFLINKKGQVIARFEPTEKMDKIEEQIKELL
jgi:glutathione peroxidase